MKVKNLQCTIWCRVIIGISCHFIFSICFKDFLVSALHTVICSSWILFGCPAWGGITFSHVVSPFPAFFHCSENSHLIFSVLIWFYATAVWSSGHFQHQNNKYFIAMIVFHYCTWYHKFYQPSFFYFSHLLLFIPSDEPRIYFVNR